MNRGMRAAAALAALLAFACVPPAPAQDFAGTSAPGPAADPGALLESGLPAPARTTRVSGAVTRWEGLPDLVTRAVAAGFGMRSMRGALGLSQTGDPEIGWTALGAALGLARDGGGAALRAVARRDRAPRPEPGALGAGIGMELGGGAWVEAGKGLTVWASSPQTWTRGAAPPLARGFELGARMEADDLAVWLAREGAVRDVLAAHRAGIAVRAGSLETWLEARDRPLRGAVGMAARTGVLRVSALLEGHPVLGETLRLGLELGPRGRRTPSGAGAGATPPPVATPPAPVDPPAAPDGSEGGTP